MHPVFDRSAPDRFPTPAAPVATGHGRPRPTTAGRLLAELTRDPAVELSNLACRLGVEEAILEHCRSGLATLSPAVQMRLAALALLLAPQHDRRARALFAQAQAALRVEEGMVESHMTYPKERFR